jgi:hypothetical protein
VTQINFRNTKEIIKKITPKQLHAGYSEADAQLVDSWVSQDHVETARLYLNPITLQFNLESGIVTYEQLEAAKQQITDRLDRLRQIWESSPTELDQEQVARLNHGMETLSAKLACRPAPISKKETTKLSPREWTAVLYGESIPFEWAIKPFSKSEKMIAGTLLGIKSAVELQGAVKKVFPGNEAQAILECQTLTTQEAAVLLIDGWRSNPDMPVRTMIPCCVQDSGEEVEQIEINQTLIFIVQQRIMEKLDIKVRKAPSAIQVFRSRCRDALTQAEMHRKNKHWARSTIKLRIKELKKFLKAEFGLTLECFFVDRSVFSEAERQLSDSRAKSISGCSVGELYDGEVCDD